MEDVEIAAKIIGEKFGIQPDTIINYCRLWQHFEVPRDTIMIYGRLWQLETWLREMVYLELKAEKGTVDESILSRSKSYRETEKRLTHMVTTQESILAYTDFSKLWELVLGENWRLFEPYFPPNDILKAKVEELKSIRNRVAHFREPHKDDLRRVEQFLRDVDQGFWRFCTSYTFQVELSTDEKKPFSDLFASKGHPLVSHGTGSWYNSDWMDNEVEFGLTQSVRPWVDYSQLSKPVLVAPGVLYHVDFFTKRVLINYGEVLNQTKYLHERCIHIGLNTFWNQFEISLPSVLGLEVIGDTVLEFLHIILQSSYVGDRKDLEDRTAENLAAEWPEYVLPPRNPLCWLYKDMPGSFFVV